MVPTTYYDFFGGCAAVAGTLIGLLFVAISVSPHKDTGRRAPLSFQVQAAVAFATLIGPLVAALAALLPGNNLGHTIVVLACAGISSTIGMALLTLRNRPTGRHLRGLVIIPVLGCLFILQLFNGIDLSLHPADQDPIYRQAILMLIFFLIAIHRAWEMMGVRDTGAAVVVSDLVRERRTSAVVPDGDVEDGHVALAGPGQPSAASNDPSKQRVDGAVIAADGASPPPVGPEERLP